jgi:predicted nucleotidyltransferase
MLTGITQNRDQLRKRVHRFLHSPAHAKGEILETLARLNQFGRVIVFGGAIRDLALHGNREFPSDIDVVVETTDVEALSSCMCAMSAIRNRFGGYRFSTTKWKFDVWRLEDTWALREGHVSGRTAEALLATTFFDWDAIAYDFTNGQLLIHDGYFDRLQLGIVDINLEPNPNPIGNARRALDIYRHGSAALAPKLAAFVATSARAWIGGRSFELAREDLAGAQAYLADFESSGGQPVRRRVEQLRLA